MFMYANTRAARNGLYLYFTTSSEAKRFQCPGGVYVPSPSDQKLAMARCSFVRLSARGLLILATLFTFIYSGKNYWSYSDDKKTYSKYLAVTAVEKKIEKDSVDKAKAILAAVNFEMKRWESKVK